MPKNPRVLCIGSANMDIVMRMERIPDRGETLITNKTYDFIPGGKGANCAVACARLEADTMFCTRVGGDLNGNKLKQMYIDNKIDPRFIYVDKRSQTGLAGIFLESDGSNRIAVYPGANNAISEDDLEEAFMSYPDAVLMQFEIPEHIVVKASEMAGKRGIPVIIDAGPARADYPIGALGRLEIFSPNETETKTFTGISPDTLTEAVQATIKLSTKVNAKYIVLKLGGRGSYIYDGRNSEIVPSYQVPVVDTTAAGDAFTAALTIEYLRSGNILRAAKYANAVGALTVTKLGASTSLPTYAEAEDFIKHRNIKL